MRFRAILNFSPECTQDVARQPHDGANSTTCDDASLRPVSAVGNARILSISYLSGSVSSRSRVRDGAELVTNSDPSLLTEEIDSPTAASSSLLICSARKKQLSLGEKKLQRNAHFAAMEKLTLPVLSFSPSLLFLSFPK